MDINPYVNPNDYTPTQAAVVFSYREFQKVLNVTSSDDIAKEFESLTEAERKEFGGAVISCIHAGRGCYTSIKSGRHIFAYFYFSFSTELVDDCRIILCCITELGIEESASPFDCASRWRILGPSWNYDYFRTPGRGGETVVLTDFQIIPTIPTPIVGD
jgi:hypothetical protein